MSGRTPVGAGRAMVAALCVALLCAAWGPARASAQASGVLVVVEIQTDEDEPIAARMRSELARRGYEVLGRRTEIVRDGREDEGTRSDDAAVHANEVLDDRAGGYVGVHTADDHLDVCAQATADALPRCESLPIGAAPDLTVLQAVEILRARLLDARPEPSEPATAVAPELEPPADPAPPVAEASEALSIRLDLELGVGTSIPIDGGLPSVDGSVAVGARLAWLSVRLAGRLPWHPSIVDAPEGRARVAAYQLALEASALLPIMAEPRVELELGGRVGGGWLVVSGEATDGVDDRAVTVGHGLAAGHVGLGVGPDEAWTVVLRLHAGAAFPTPVIRFGARDVARWGAPWLAAELALRVTP